MATPNDWGDSPVASAVVAQPNDWGDHPASQATDTKSLPDVPTQVMTSIQNQAKGLFETIHAAFDPRAQVELGDKIVGAQLHEWDRAKENYHKGDYLGAITGALGAAVPILGPMINQSADKLATPGQRAEGVTDIALPLLLGKAGGLAEEASAKGGSLVAPIAKGTAAAIPDIPIFPRSVGDFVKPFRAGAGGFRNARDAQAAQDVAALRTAQPSAPYPTEMLGANPTPEPPSLRVARPGAPQPEIRVAQPAEATPIRPETVTVEPEARWDPSTLPPDPIKSTEAFRKGLEDLRNRRASTPESRKEPPASETPKEAPPSDLTQKLNDLLRKEKIKGGFDPDRPLGEVKGGRYPNRFAGDDSPVINSAEQRTSGSNLPVANPGMVAKNLADKLGGKVSVEMFDKIIKNPAGVRTLGALQQEGYVPDSEVIAMVRRRLMKKTNIATEMNKVGK